MGLFCITEGCIISAQLAKKWCYGPFFIVDNLRRIKIISLSDKQVPCCIQYFMMIHSQCTTSQIFTLHEAIEFVDQLVIPSQEHAQLHDAFLVAPMCNPFKRKLWGCKGFRVYHLIKVNWFNAMEIEVASMEYWLLI